jgi:redox-sensing transcriptional repressor
MAFDPDRTESQVPLPALERLATYIRCLMQLEEEGTWTVSSQDMEKRTGVSASQFRKDLSYFGEFGKRGIGYSVGDLHQRIAQVLRIEEEQPVLLIGAGRLGSALIAYSGWKAYRFRIAAVFDKDPGKVGTRIRRLLVRDIESLETVNAELGARMGILAVPAWEAQAAADCLVRAGIHGILNFAPVRLVVPNGVRIRDVCFICELTVLSYLIQQESHLPEAAPLPILEELDPTPADG